MDDTEAIQAMQGPIITGVTLVDRIEREDRGAFRSQSLPGHLIHVCTAGEVEQCAGGVTQRFGDGDAIWYYEDEPVRGTILQAPWIFYTINFHAPALPPPPLTERVRPVKPDIVERVDRLLQVWRATEMPGLRRQLQVHAMLLDLIADLLPAQQQYQRVDTPAQLWWELEALLRERLDEPIDLTLLEKLCGRSRRSISRACRLATGRPPIKRVKEIRLAYARGLAQLSDLSMTEIALRVGYTRVQEFSRDYHAHFGSTPTQDRRAGPDYRRRELSDEEHAT